MTARARSLSYARWVDRHRRAILRASLLVAAIAGWLTAQLPVEADLSYLLPPSAASVVQLRAIEQRARVIGTVMIAVTSDDPVRRARAARALHERLRGLPPGLVSTVTFDDGVARRFAWTHRWLAVSLEDLTAARDALRTRIAEAKLEANPLYVELDDAPPAATRGVALRERLREAEAKKDQPGELVSEDGHVQLMIVRTAYSSGDVDRDHELLATLGAAIAGVRREVGGVDIGCAGDVVLTVAEHDAILDGMALAIALTVGLVLAALFLYYRSLIAIGALSWSLGVGALATFGFTRLAVGHLNLATAFLSSIVIGNGINFGILVVARYQEAQRAGAEGIEALAVAIRGTLAGTLAAALIAAVAYASLVMTAFRGFRDFGIIAGVGTLLCWIAAYTVLPAALAIAARARLLRPRAEPAIGHVLARLAPRRPGGRAAVMLGLSLAAIVLTWRYLAGDPFESNFHNLRSRSAAIDEETRWMTTIDRGFGQGISGGFVIAVAHREDTGPLLAKLRAVDAGKDRAHRLFSRIESVAELLPADQPAKLALLGELRRMLTAEALDELSGPDRADALALRPPADLVALRDEDLPDELAWPYIEADGSRGKLVLAMPGWGYDNWDAHDIVRFARDVRQLELPPDVLLGGSSFVFADMLSLLDRDGPRATLVALVGAIVLVFVIVGRRRHGLVTVGCMLCGVLVMLSLGSLLGLRVNFLDFVALPITIGIGIDYAVNITARDRHDPSLGPAGLLASTGGAVLLCSFTTIVGYGSLLLSQSQGIRSFGAAAILGEATCLGAALLFAPALLSLGRRPSAHPPSTTASMA